MKTKFTKKMFALFFLIIFTFVLAGCSKNSPMKELYFKGESDNWKGLLVQEYSEIWSTDENGKIIYNNAMRENLYLQYRGRNSNEIGHLKYEYRGPNGGGSGEVYPRPDRYGYIQCGGGGGKGVALAREDGIFSLTLEWDGDRKETLQLTTKEPVGKTDTENKSIVLPASNNLVPFFVRKINPLDDRQQEVFLGCWDLYQGKIQFEDIPLFKTSNGHYRLFWNGGNEILIAPERNDGNILITDQNPRVNLRKLDVEADFDTLVKYSPDSDKTVAVYKPKWDEKPVLKIQKGEHVENTILDPAYLPVDLLSPVGLAFEDYKIKVFMEFSSKPKENGGSSFGILMGSYDGKDVVWRILSKDIGVMEAGAGTRMVKHQNKIVISEQDGRIKTLDIDNEKIHLLNNVSNYITDFQNKYIKETECQVPPSVFSYNEMLIINWVPAVVSSKEIGPGIADNFVPTAAVLAVKYDQIIGEIKANRNMIIVSKNGQVTDKKQINWYMFPTSWQFPQD